ncbi:MAG: OsmC-like protein [Dehalococcoidia bacterium]|nr:OsmC-like protein [Dehalococcoidia bacterium]
MSLREVQRPIKASYRREPEKAKITLTARASEMVQDSMSCSIDIGRAIYQAQAHAGVGGAGTGACSGDLLLGALAACTQITVQMVAEAMGLSLDKIDVTVEGDLDLKGTLGVDPSAPVGFQNIRSAVHLEGQATEKELSTLKELAERYCVVLATLRNPPEVEVKWEHT